VLFSKGKRLPPQKLAQSHISSESFPHVLSQQQLREQVHYEAAAFTPELAPQTRLNEIECPFPTGFINEVIRPDSGDGARFIQ
jgi:hypothetical protein